MASRRVEPLQEDPRIFVGVRVGQKSQDAASPGFVAGYWMEPENGEGWSVVLFDSEEHARAAAPEPGSSPGPGVTIKHVQFAPVVAHA